ncbi:MAG: hypothetical protein QOD09_1738, partial [Bradyrhizobium sp.]|nr:hypothetical protein [Bradyrhizobium sp.]
CIHSFAGLTARSLEFFDSAAVKACFYRSEPD